MLAFALPFKFMFVLFHAACGLASRLRGSINPLLALPTAPIAFGIVVDTIVLYGITSTALHHPFMTAALCFCFLLRRHKPSLKRSRIIPGIESRPFLQPGVLLSVHVASSVLVSVVVVVAVSLLQRVQWLARVRVVMRLVLGQGSIC